jgi:hypothetical protein
MMPNHSLEPTPVGRFGFTIDIVVPAWLSFGR